MLVRVELQRQSDAKTQRYNGTSFNVILALKPEEKLSRGQRRLWGAITKSDKSGKTLPQSAYNYELKNALRRCRAKKRHALSPAIGALDAGGGRVLDRGKDVGEGNNDRGLVFKGDCQQRQGFSVQRRLSTTTGV
jgi:hypothetical protein